MELYITGYCLISEGKVILNDRLIFFQENFTNFADFIKTVYKQEQINYPKFYKMDSLSKLGFMAADLVLKTGALGKYTGDQVGVVLANSSSSLDTDLVYNDTIKDRKNYFPSPSVFVYTLPNIVIGEVCIRHKLKGENAFLISESFDAGMIHDYVTELFFNSRVEASVCGWTEMMGNNHTALVMLVEKVPGLTAGSSSQPLPFQTTTINRIIERN